MLSSFSLFREARFVRNPWKWLLLLLLFLVPPADARPTLEDGVLRLGGDYGYPPFEYLQDDGRAAGFNVALVRAIARDLEVEVVADLGPWERRRRAIEEGEIDVLPMFVSERRARYVDFATPHVIVYHEIFVRRGESRIDTLADLDGREVIVQRAAYTHDYLQDFDLDVDPVLVETERDAIRLLASGRYDAALVSEHGGRRLLRELELDQISTAGPPILPVEYALAVTRGNTELLTALNDSIAQLKDSGEFNRLYEQWLAGPEGPGWQNVMRYITGFLAAGLMLMGFAIGWIVTLRRQVASRTKVIQEELAVRRATEAALRESEEDSRASFEHAGAGMARVDLDGRIFAVNERLCTMLGYSREVLQGMYLPDLCAPEYVAELQRRMADCLGRSNGVVQMEPRLRHRDGASIIAGITLNLLRSTTGAPRCFIFVAQDLSEIRQLAEDLDYHSQHDVLTGLLNRTELERQLERLIDKSAEDHREHTLLLLDLDQFKLINETRGHALGDQMLQQVARRLRMMLGQDDRIARLGGDEFGILLPDTAMEQALRVAETLRAGVEKSVLRSGEESFQLTASIGLVPVVSDTGNAGEVLRHADAACYAAKEEGRNRVHVYQADDERLVERHSEMGWAREVAVALDEGRFQLYFQTIEPLQDQQSPGVSLEVLLRMIDREGQPVAAGLFMPAAERYFVAQKVDRWVISRTLDWFSRHRSALAALSMVTINLSGRSLGDKRFLDDILQLLHESGLPPSLFCFEITETAAIANLLNAQGAIHRLQAIGCRFALDDFGIGLSSLAYLKHLPADFLKIDGSFVRDIFEDAQDRAMVAEINDLGHIMDKKTIAEHAETEAVVSELRAMGVDMAQGYALSHPRPIDELLSLHPKTTNDEVNLR
jgi:diguanylate cyclase (GGDEF)-like protein/PAS domain S-box-containing protein